MYHFRIFEIFAQVFTEVQKSMEEDEWEAGKELPQDEKQRESASREIYSRFISFKFSIILRFVKII